MRANRDGEGGTIYKVNGRKKTTIIGMTSRIFGRRWVCGTSACLGFRLAYVCAVHTLGLYVRLTIRIVNSGSFDIYLRESVVFIERS